MLHTDVEKSCSDSRDGSDGGASVGVAVGDEAEVGAGTSRMFAASELVTGRTALSAVPTPKTGTPEGRLEGTMAPTRGLPRSVEMGFPKTLPKKKARRRHCHRMFIDDPGQMVRDDLGL